METEQLCSELAAAVRNELDRRDTIQDAQVRDRIDAVIVERSRQEYIPLKEKLALRFEDMTAWMSCFSGRISQR